MNARLTPAEVLADFERFSRQCEEAEYTDTGEAWEYLNGLAACVRSMLDGSMNDDSFEDLPPDILLTEQDSSMNEGDRVRLSPHLDLWMQGHRYGTITSTMVNEENVRTCLIRMDRDGSQHWVSAEDLESWPTPVVAMNVDRMVMGPAYHENSPRPGDSHLESECPGGDRWPCSMNGPAK